MKLTDILKKIYQVNRSLFRELKEQRRIHQQVQHLEVKDLYEQVHAEAAPCFVLSTGRCGTKLLTNILRQTGAVKTAHVLLRGVCLS